MSISDYVQNADLSYEQILNMAKQKILKNAQSDNRDYEKLKQYLEDVMYGTSNEHQKLQEVIQQYLSEKINAKVKNYDFSTNIVEVDENNIQQRAIELQNMIKERVSLQHKKYIEVATVKQRKEQAEKALMKIKDIEDVEDQQNKLETLIDTCKELLKQDSLEGRIKVTKDTSSLIDQADALYSQVIFFRSMVLSNQDIGAIFEKILTLLSEQGSNLASVAKDEMLDILRSPTQGSKTVSRGGFLEMEQEILEEKEKKSKKKDGKQSFSYFLRESGQNGSSFEFIDEFTDKQGKADVIFTLPTEPNQKFRISAKNWSSMALPHNFGTTSIESALLRTAGLFSTLKYGSVLGSKGKFKTDIIDITKAHNFAKAAIFVDIIMGFSQDQGYADTIVINDRSGGANNHIKVYSIYSLISKMMNNLPTPIGYKTDDIEKALQGAKHYYVHILSILKSFKVSMSIEQLDNI